MDQYADVIGELDIVANFGLIRSGKYDDVTKDLIEVVGVCHEKNVPVNFLKLIDMGIGYKSVPVVLDLKR